MSVHDNAERLSNVRRFGGSQERRMNKTRISKTHGPRQYRASWEAIEDVLTTHYYSPDLQAARVLYSAVAAHGLDGQPVWPMLVAPPGSMKTELVEALRGFPNTHLIDTVTSNTFLSGQIIDDPGPTSPSLLDRIGSDGILIVPDFGTVLAMKSENRAAVLADLRRIFDGHLRKEYGTTQDPREWHGRLTVVVATTPDVDRSYTIFQTLGERFVMVRWASPRGIDAAVAAMNQDRDRARAELQSAVGSLFDALPSGVVTLSPAIQRQIAAITEIVVKARTHVPRSSQKEMIYLPEPEGATRLAQQLCQLAKGSARIGLRSEVNDADLEVVRRAALDCVPTVRRRVLMALINDDDVSGLEIPRMTRKYALEDLTALGLLAERTGGHVLVKSARTLVEIAGL